MRTSFVIIASGANARKCAEDTFGGLPRPSRTEAAEVFSFLLQNSRRVRKIEIEPCTIPIYSESNQRRDIMGHHGDIMGTSCLRSKEVLAVWSISPRMCCRSRVTTWPILTRSQDRTPVGGGFGTKLPIVIDSQTKSGPTFKEKNEGCKMCKTASIQRGCSRILWNLRRLSTCVAA